MQCSYIRLYNGDNTCTGKNKKDACTHKHTCIFVIGFSYIIFLLYFFTFFFIIFIYTHNIFMHFSGLITFSAQYFYNINDILIHHFIAYLKAVSVPFYNIYRLKFGKMLGYGRLRQFKALLDIRYITLVINQSFYNAKPVRVGNRF